MADAGGIATWRDSLANFLMQQTELIILPGDQNYGASAADVVPNNAIFGSFPVKVVEGNHDIDFDGGVALRARFNSRPASPPGLPGCYHDVLLDGAVDLVVLQSGRTTSWVQTVVGGVGIGSPMHTWFLSILPTLTAPHLVVAFHHPTWGPVLNDTGRVFETTLDWPWHTYGVKLVLNGHSHLAFTGSKRGVKYITAAATYRQDDTLDATLHGADEDGAVLEWAQDSGYSAAILNVTAGDLSYEFVDPDGRPIPGSAGKCGMLSIPSSPETYEVVGPETDVIEDFSVCYTATVPHYITAAHIATIVPGQADVMLYVGASNVELTTISSLATLRYQRKDILPAMKGVLVMPGQQVKYRTWVTYVGIAARGLAITLETRSVS